MNLKAVDFERLVALAGRRSVDRVAAELVHDRLWAGDVSEVAGNPAKGRAEPDHPLAESHREWWERYARRNPVSRRVVCFLLGRSQTYVSALTRAMGVDGWRISMAEARAWLNRNRGWRVYPGSRRRRRAPFVGGASGAPPGKPGATS